MPLIVTFFRKELLALFIVVLSISSRVSVILFLRSTMCRLYPGRTVWWGSMRRATTTTPSLGSTCGGLWGGRQTSSPKRIQPFDTAINNLLFSNTGLDVPEPQITFANVDGIISGFVSSESSSPIIQHSHQTLCLSFEVGAGVPGDDTPHPHRARIALACST